MFLRLPEHREFSQSVDELFLATTDLTFFIAAIQLQNVTLSIANGRSCEYRYDLCLATCCSSQDQLCRSGFEMPSEFDEMPLGFLRLW